MTQAQAVNTPDVVAHDEARTNRDARVDPEIAPLKRRTGSRADDTPAWMRANRAQAASARRRF